MGGGMLLEQKGVKGKRVDRPQETSEGSWRQAEGG